MSDPFALRVGPACVVLHGDIDPARWALDANHPRFFSRLAPSPVDLQITWCSIGRPAGPPIFRMGGVASFYRVAGCLSVRLGEDDRSLAADRVLSLEASGVAGTILMDSDRCPDPMSRYPLEYPLEDLLFRHLMPAYDALLVHACAVSWRGGGYLFVGSSGAGKSTTARLWSSAGAAILNDDRVVLEAGRDGIHIHPTPWFGEYPDVGEESAPLRAIYLLRKGEDVAFEPLHPAAAAAHIFAKSFPPLWDPARVERALTVLDRVCQQVPCGWLTVPPDSRAVAWVQGNEGRSW